MIKINQLTYYFNKEKSLLHNINSTLLPGNIYGLLGLNGEGKTTFLKLITGLLYPREGEITINNISSLSRNSDFLSNFYFLPDQISNTHLTGSTYQKIYSCFYKDFSEEDFDKNLSLFGIDKKTKINSYSLGQQKKFYIAFALATNTKLLIMDEPTNGLDIPSKTIFRKLLASNITEDKIILISTHLVKDLENLIDHLLILQNGKMVLDMNISQILEHYYFGNSPQNSDHILYQEQYLATQRYIAKNIDNKESVVDIELLFNAIQNQKN